MNENKVTLKGAECSTHFLLAGLIRQMAQDAGREVVSVYHNRKEGRVGRAAHTIEADWHDLNEGRGICDMHLDFSQAGVLLVILDVVDDGMGNPVTDDPDGESPRSDNEERLRQRLVAAESALQIEDERWVWNEGAGIYTRPIDVPPQCSSTWTNPATGKMVTCQRNRGHGGNHLRELDGDDTEWTNTDQEVPF